MKSDIIDFIIDRVMDTINSDLFMGNGGIEVLFTDEEVKKIKGEKYDRKMSEL